MNDSDSNPDTPHRTPHVSYFIHTDQAIVTTSAAVHAPRLHMPSSACSEHVQVHVAHDNMYSGLTSAPQLINFTVLGDLP